MKDNEYKCDDCGGVFEKACCNEAMLEEAKELWGIKEQSDDTAMVCNGCFKRLMTLFN